MEDFTQQFELDCAPLRAYQGLTEEIPQWWSELFEGRATSLGDRFTVRFGESIFKTMEVAGLKTGQRVAWKVVDSIIDIPELDRKTEWIGTSILWDIRALGNKTGLTLTHKGLNPEVECYDICRVGWGNFTHSLIDHLLWEKGRPFKTAV